jgi:flagellar protein FlgJ
VIAPASPSSATTPAAPSPERAELAAAARQFEAIFVRQMLAAARKSDFGGDLFGDQGTQTFRQMQDEHFADLAANRGAFGLASMIEAQLAAHVPVKVADNGL